MSDPSTPDTEKPKRNRSKQVFYTDELAASICERISHGEALHAICRLRGMPRFSTFMRWVDTRPVLEAQYSRAMELRAHWHADGLIGLADTKPEYVTTVDEDGRTTSRIDPAWVNWMRLRIDARKWIASKLYPKIYGERLHAEVTGKDGKPIEYRDVGTLSDAELERIAATSVVAPTAPQTLN